MVLVASNEAYGMLSHRRTMRLAAICAALAIAGCARHPDVVSPVRYGSIKDESGAAQRTPARGPAKASAKIDGPSTPTPSKTAVKSRPPEPVADIPVAAPAPVVAKTEVAPAAPPVPVAAPATAPAPSSSPGPAAVRPSAPPAAPGSNGTTKAERDESVRLVTEGQQLFDEGKVVEARRRFIAALNGLSPEATLALARSFDTHYLYKLAKSDGAPDMQRALQLYQSAVQRGAKDAQEDLDRLRATLGQPAR